jgi:hypothetical protein
MVKRAEAMIKALVTGALSVTPKKNKPRNIRRIREE